MVISVCIFLGGYLLAYTPYTGIHFLDLDDAESAFPIFNMHVRVSVDLSKSDFFSLIMQVIIKIQSLSVVICSLTVKCNLTKSCIL